MSVPEQAVWTRRHTIGVVVLLGVAVALIATVLAGVLPSSNPGAAGTASSDGQSADEPAGSDSTPTSTSSASPTPSGGDEQADTDALDSFLVVTNRPIDADQVMDSDEIRAVADGPILSELEAESLELEANDWTKAGVPTVLWSKRVSPADAPPGDPIIVEACIDSSDVAITSSDGVQLASTAATRAINIFTLEAAGDTLRVTARDFPDDPAC